MNELSNDDITFLLEGLDALPESRKFHLLFDALIKGKGHATYETITAMMEKSKEGDSQLNETLILIKAKLIQMRDKSVVQDAADFLRDKKRSDT